MTNDKAAREIERLRAENEELIAGINKAGALASQAASPELILQALSNVLGNIASTDKEGE